MKPSVLAELLRIPYFKHCHEIAIAILRYTVWFLSHQSLDSCSHCKDHGAFYGKPTALSNMSIMTISSSSENSGFDEILTEGQRAVHDVKSFTSNENGNKLVRIIARVEY